jgi:hypothetical protein
MKMLYKTFFLLFLLSVFPSFNTLYKPVYQTDCAEVPELNQKILVFVNGKVGKKIGRGECWDLAAEALNQAGAEWDHNYGFGKPVNAEKDCIYPGDIIQFKGVKLQYEFNGSICKEEMAMHTAIIYEVKKKNSYILAEQNTSYGGRKVTLKSLDVNNITKGKFQIYRPVQ